MQRRGVAIETLMLLSGCILLPTTTWGGSFAQVYAEVQWVDCSNSQPVQAFCTTGTVQNSHSSGNASGFADFAIGDLTVDAIAIGGPGIVTANAKFGDSLYFGGDYAGLFGQVKMTATGSWAGDSSSASASLQAGFLVNGTRQQNAIAAQTSRVGAYCNGGVIGTEACSSSDGQNLSVSATFPLVPDGVSFVFTLGAFTTGDGAAHYTDPITVTLPQGVTSRGSPRAPLCRSRQVLC